ncbi:hypothetical protein NQ095_08420 [Rossellomorea sp. SC111]|uniref:hypothetical protein n=1 Tax=Rossellomorea sp. SC111 TaxID=2968985 RepID=UPI00215B0DCC|nr:hypothetical protein [Rossellomorea sp. SC111]MCR8848423.1 hypothetical protein [Rossellomorea sp. SC111]
MTKEKFHIPMPEEKMVKREIHTIIGLGMKPKQSFSAFIWKMQKELGFRYLFANQRDGIIMTFSIMAALIFFMSTVTEGSGAGERVYGAVFLVSPLLFMALSLYDSIGKRQSAVLEVEMTAKYNLHQVSAFRMLHFSILSILVNTFVIVCLVWSGHSFEILRALMISTTSLFLFSTFYLMVFMKGRFGLGALKVGVGWSILNFIPLVVDRVVYMQFLMTAPVLVYGLVLAVTMVCNLYYLSKLVRMRPAEGVL